MAFSRGAGTAIAEEGRYRLKHQWRKNQESLYGESLRGGRIEGGEEWYE